MMLVLASPLCSGLVGLIVGGINLKHPARKAQSKNLIIAGVVGGYLWQQAGSSIAITVSVAVVIAGLVLLMTTARAHHREQKHR